MVLKHLTNASGFSGRMPAAALCWAIIVIIRPIRHNCSHIQVHLYGDGDTAAYCNVRKAVAVASPVRRKAKVTRPVRMCMQPNQCHPKQQMIRQRMVAHVIIPEWSAYA